MSTNMRNAYFSIPITLFSLSHASLFYKSFHHQSLCYNCRQLHSQETIQCCEFCHCFVGGAEESEYMTTGLVEPPERDGAAVRSIRVGAKKGRNVAAMAMAKKKPRLHNAVGLQRLFMLCRQVFDGVPGSVPSPGDVQRLCNILDGMTPEDVGLSSNLQFFQPKTKVEGNPRVTFTTIYNCNNFSLCLFFLPANAVIPLHNHPGMTVFSKLLLGSMHIKAYDWVDRDSELSSRADAVKEGIGRRLARLKADKIFTAPCNTSVLYPTSGGNIHEFKAITPCAVLDVLGPPYTMDDGRDCSYYRDIPFNPLSKAEEDGELYGWLEEIEMPKDGEMDVIQYLGPQVVE
nr:plant cysteine oxidase 2-like [Ipomoea batatas]